MSSLIHDEAFVLAGEMVGLIRHWLREEEIRDAFGEFYRMAMKAIKR